MEEKLRDQPVQHDRLGAHQALLTEMEALRLAIIQAPDDDGLIALSSKVQGLEDSLHTLSRGEAGMLSAAWAGFLASVPSPAAVKPCGGDDVK